MAVNIEEIMPKTSAGKPMVVLSDTDKFMHNFVVEPTPGGFIFYGVRVTKGAVPQELSGMYSTMKLAVQHVKKYIEDAKPSKSVTRDKKYEANHKVA